jgi:hypothetical protein
VKTVVPAIKALMAKELVEEYMLKQNQVAEVLGISQSAVSKYTRQVRGHLIETSELKDLDPIISKMVNLLVNGNNNRSEFLSLFCQTCATIRKKKLMCQFCQKTDPKIKTEECNFCLTYKSP